MPASAGRGGAPRARTRLKRPTNARPTRHGTPLRCACCFAVLPPATVRRSSPVDSRVRSARRPSRHTPGVRRLPRRVAYCPGTSVRTANATQRQRTQSCAVGPIPAWLHRHAPESRRLRCRRSPAQATLAARAHNATEVCRLHLSPKRQLFNFDFILFLISFWEFAQVHSARVSISWWRRWQSQLRAALARSHVGGSHLDGTPRRAMRARAEGVGERQVVAAAS